MATTDPAQPGAQQTMERLLRLLVQKSGSDLYISAHAQPTMRLHGLCVPASSRALGPQDPVQLLAVLIGEQSAKALHPPQTLQNVVSLQDSGRLRVSVFFQRGALAFAASSGASAQSLAQGQALLQTLGFAPQRMADLPGLVAARTLAMLVNEAADAVQQGVCDVPGANAAMKLGVNYPAGPFEWLQRWGTPAVVGVLHALDDFYRGERYRVSPWLRQQACAALGGA